MDKISLSNGLSRLKKMKTHLLRETRENGSTIGNNGMEKMISVVNELQDISATLNIPLQLDLPQIAVVGGQSAGKSSVLENFVGKDFLPRGKDIVTRTPLILQLIHNKENNKEYGKFIHKPDKQYYNFNEIRLEIEKETEKLTGCDKGISNNPIRLKIFSPNVLDLTLIDLPGLTKVPVGDQPENIEDQIKNLILQFIRQENCLILAVTPANTDLTNSDALKLAKEVDPKGLRTIGVLTKLDIMDEGTDAREILENKKVPLMRGYVGVISRSQKDIDNKKKIEDSARDEEAFFLGHPAYQDLADRLGTKYLQFVLNQQLTEHIRENLPAFREKLQKKKFDIERKMDYDEDFEADDLAAKERVLSQIVHRLKGQFRNEIGCYESEDTGEVLNGGSKINLLIHEKFPKEIAKITLDNKKLREKIAISIQNIRGVNVGIFPPDMAFQNVAKEQIKRLKDPSIRCIGSCIEILNDILLSSCATMSRYPNLRELTEEILTNRVAECEKKCIRDLNYQFEMELSYINTRHVDFFHLPAIPIRDGEVEEDLSYSTDPRMVDKFQTLVNRYMEIFLKKMYDIVARVFMHSAIKEIKDYIDVGFSTELSRNNMEDDSLMELSCNEQQKRDEMARVLNACKEGLKILNQVSSKILTA